MMMISGVPLRSVLGRDKDRSGTGENCFATRRCGTSRRNYRCTKAEIGK